MSGFHGFSLHLCMCAHSEQWCGSRSWSWRRRRAAVCACRPQQQEGSWQTASAESERWSTANTPPGREKGRVSNSAPQTHVTYTQVCVALLIGKRQWVLFNRARTSSWTITEPQPVNIYICITLIPTFILTTGSNCATSCLVLTWKRLLLSSPVDLSIAHLFKFNNNSAPFESHYCHLQGWCKTKGKHYKL